MPGLRDFFRSDAFTPASAVFPAIDTARLESDLSLASEGKARGKRNAPGPDETGLDSIETRIIARVGDLRRKGIDTYFENFRVYDSRLARAGDARDEVEIAASTARGDFQSQVAVWKARMATPMSKIRDAVADLRHFREKHRVLHIARQASFPNWFLIVLFVAIIEALANSLLFAKVMSQGFMGGAGLAGMIAAANAMIASLTTYFARNLNHRSPFWKLIGLVSFVVGAVVCIGFNLGVAHFRDALEAGLELEPALSRSWHALWTTPLALDSFLSALLMLLGIAAAIIVGLKTYHTIDPYPGYPAVYGEVTRARAEYAFDLNDAIATLEHDRNNAIDELRDANLQMKTWIREAVDALYGQSSLRSELDRFIEQCDTKASALLATYRDANRAARTGGPGVAVVPVPRHFDQPYAFPEMSLARPAEALREQALSEQARVSDLVSAAIADIERAYSEAIAVYPTIQELEASLAAGGDPFSRAPKRTESGTPGLAGSNP